MTNPSEIDLSDSAKVPLVSVDWLAAHLGDAKVRVLDASWKLPGAARSARSDYQEGHIPGAGFFDLDGACDPDNALPHTMPAPVHFAVALQRLGVGKDDLLIFYDSGGVFAAARARWMARAFGHRKAYVLDGGLAAWQDAGHAVDNAAVLCPVGDFEAQFQPDMIAITDDVMAALENGAAQIVDARSPGRFAGSEPEPREGIRPGHMPGATNVFYGDLYGGDGRLRPPAELTEIFAHSGVSIDQDIITTCGSGVTACCLALALEVLGKEEVRIYDGSWSEWGGRHDLPIVTESESSVG